MERDFLSFVPGVTASAGCFILFGTTAPLRRLYRSWFRRLAPSRMCHGCCTGGRSREQDHERLEHDKCEIGEHSMAELAVSSLAARAETTTENSSFPDVWPVNPNFNAGYRLPPPTTTTMDMTSNSPLDVDFITTATPYNKDAVHVSGNGTIGTGLAGTTSGIAGPQPFSLILPSPPASVRSPIDVMRASSPAPSLRPSPSLLDQRRRLMQGDDVFFTPHYPRSVPQYHQHLDVDKGSDTALR